MSDKSCFSSRADKRNQLRLMWACLAWAFLFAAGALVIKGEIVPPGPFLWAIAALPVLAAIFVILAYLRFLRETDELQRLIQLEGLAFGFGGGFFAICAWAVFELLGAPPSLSKLTSLMLFLYVVGVLIGHRRYR